MPFPPLTITAIPDLPEISPGDDLPALLRHAAGPLLNSEAILVVAQKIVSKAEGAIVDLRNIAPSPLALEWSTRWDLDPRQIELVLRQSVRIVKMDRGVLITETRHGFIMANAGVDRSNVPGDHYATILPSDPDASARGLHQALGCGAVILSDTFGRPWREGLINAAIGLSGIAPLEDLRDTPDSHGRPLRATILATADELAAAAGLVMRKTNRTPAAVITGFPFAPASDTSAQDLVRPPDRDLFR
jgi:coenzyme F420-0:L-glutamate ligase/coenzyme F420-1:gamma-L-glutamate ligase